jgi:hypothetical protein
VKDENPNKVFKNKTFMDKFRKDDADPVDIAKKARHLAKIFDFIDAAAFMDGLDLSVAEQEEISKDMYKSLVNDGIDLDGVDFMKILEKYGPPIFTGGLE